MMEWLVWQSVHTGAPSTPRSTALPWTLALYSAASLSWHMPHMSGVPFFHSSVLVETSSCAAPWQVSQSGAAVLPFFNSAACTLCQKFCTSDQWQLRSEEHTSELQSHHDLV